MTILGIRLSATDANWYMSVGDMLFIRDKTKGRDCGYVYLEGRGTFYCIEVEDQMATALLLKFPEMQTMDYTDIG